MRRTVVVLAEHTPAAAFRYEQLFEANKKFLASGSFDSSLSSKPHRPCYMAITCSDSRIPFRKAVGNDQFYPFIHRNVANLVLHSDVSIHGAVQYAVDHLGVRHIVVVGHYGCGGVTAAMSPQDGSRGVVDKWLRHVEDVARMYRAELEGLSQEEKVNRVIDLNVRNSVYNLGLSDAVKAVWARGDPLSLHGAVYDLHSGELKDLKVDASDLQQVRRLA